MTNMAPTPEVTYNTHPGTMDMLNPGDYFKLPERDEALGVLEILPCALEGRVYLRLVGLGGIIFDQDYAANTEIRAMGDVAEVGYIEIDLDTTILGDYNRNTMPSSVVEVKRPDEGDDGLDSVGAGV